MLKNGGLFLEFDFVVRYRLSLSDHAQVAAMSFPSTSPTGPGFIYFIRNPSLPNEFKIGLSSDPVSRVKQLSSAGCSSDLMLHRVFQVQNMLSIEQSLHEFFASHRKLPGKEWFWIVTPAQQIAMNIFAIEQEEWGQFGDWLDEHISSVVDAFNAYNIEFKQVPIEYLENMNSQSKNFPR